MHKKNKFLKIGRKVFIVHDYGIFTLRQPSWWYSRAGELG